MLEEEMKRRLVVAERDVSRDIVEVFRVVLLDMLIILLLIESASAAANCTSY